MSDTTSTGMAPGFGGFATTAAGQMQYMNRQHNPYAFLQQQPEIADTAPAASQELASGGLAGMRLADGGNAGNVNGLLQAGNINLHNRPRVQNADGSISTVRSITIGDDQGRSVLIPTVVGDKVVSDQDAIDHYRQSGEHLGIFSDEDSADNYAQSLHEDQAREYVPRGPSQPSEYASGGLAGLNPQQEQQWAKFMRYHQMARYRQGGAVWQRLGEGGDASSAGAGDNGPGGNNGTTDTGNTDTGTGGGGQGQGSGGGQPGTLAGFTIDNSNPDAYGLNGLSMAANAPSPSQPSNVTFDNDPGHASYMDIGQQPTAFADPGKAMGYPSPYVGNPSKDVFGTYAALGLVGAGKSALGGAVPGASTAIGLGAKAANIDPTASLASAFGAPAPTAAQSFGASIGSTLGSIGGPIGAGLGAAIGAAAANHGFANNPGMGGTMGNDIGSDVGSGNTAGTGSASDATDLTALIKKINAALQSSASTGQQGYAAGGSVQGRGMPNHAFHQGSGLVHGTSDGRADALHTHVPQGSYVVPADVVSGLGQGNTMSGAKKLAGLIPQNVPPMPPQGQPGMAGGGMVPVRLSAGEFHIHPAHVAALGGGNLKAGSDKLDQMVGHVRTANMRQVASMPPPR